MALRAFRVGARGSRLSRAQAMGALAFLARVQPGFKARLVAVETPGDRDLVTPIEESAPDFFTRDLDEAVSDGRIDFAIHSAKDLPPDPAPGLDWFWLPCREDPRDALVFRTAAAGRIRTVGVSGERRRLYAAARFPKARTRPVRGAIDARLAQLRAGDFDAVPMALAGLRRLYPALFPSEVSADPTARAEALAAFRGLTVEPIPLAELEPPEAQGFLAIVFRAGDARLHALRARFVKAVRFVSAGVGDAGLCTLAGARDLAAADTVLYDDLLGADLKTYVPPRARLVHVGKRCGAHALAQPEITRLICDEARKGRRVVRLKGGDAGLFGRLAEETDALTALGIPFLVRPGVSALTAATTGTGLLLTRRGVSTGFTVYTPRRAGDAIDRAPDESRNPRVEFMATRRVQDEARRLVAAGWPAATPCAIVWDAAGPRECVQRATLADFVASAPSAGADLADAAGLFIVGSAAASEWPRLGFFKGARVLVTCSEAVREKACRRIEDGGGRPLPRPLIRLVPRVRTDWEKEVAAADAVTLTSPAAVRVFFEVCSLDRRRLPEFYTCGAGTDAALRRYGVASDLMPAADYSAAGLIAEIAKRDLTGRRVLRLRSAKAGGDVARALRKAGARVKDLVLYDNEPVAYDAPPPDFDAVFFASASAVEVFLARYGAKALRGKAVYAIGLPTRAALPPRWRGRAILLPLEDF